MCLLSYMHTPLDLSDWYDKKYRYILGTDALLYCMYTWRLRLEQAAQWALSCEWITWVTIIGRSFHIIINITDTREYIPGILTTMWYYVIYTIIDVKIEIGSYLPKIICWTTVND